MIAVAEFAAAMVLARWCSDVTADPSPRTQAQPAAIVVNNASIRDVEQACVRNYAQLAHHEYQNASTAADEMRAAIQAFCATPNEALLMRAREAWIAAREIYGRTETFRFGNGPIDSTRGGTETFINAWPVDESYIEPESDTATTGIIRDRAKYPALGRAILKLHNQRGGETNVCTGWHAIEFMLWGRDRSETGPGNRSYADYLDDVSSYADRRREYLLEITDLLCEDLARLARVWAPDTDNYRRRFEQDPKALRAMFVGPGLLTGFEMSGERLAVALETRDQEEEHSCFSDTTHLDFRANIRGVALVIRGSNGGGLLDFVRTKDAATADRLAQALDRAVIAIDAMPAPFDRAIRMADDTPEREKLSAALDAIETLGEEISRTAKLMGIEVPSEPQG
ncbi:MAG: imelysin family protein [Limnohabitans sp.]|nr:imelysin family protein [Limnohabitans sp.]